MNDLSPSLARFINNLENALDELQMAIQEARQLQAQPSREGAIQLAETLYDQIDGYGKFGNFFIDPRLDDIQNEIAESGH